MTARPHKPGRLGHELKEYLALSLYLWITFGALELLKTSILQAHHIGVFPYGFAALKALVCAKFILLGRVAGVARTRSGERLVVSIARKGVALLLVLVVLSLIEPMLVALIHGRPVSTSLSDLGGGKPFQMAATILMLLLILIPYIAVHAVSEALGEGELRRLLLARAATEESN